MPALSTLKSNRTRAKNALSREEQEKLISYCNKNGTNSSSEQEIVKIFFMIGKTILNLETKLSRFELANKKLIARYFQRELIFEYFVSQILFENKFC